MRVLVPVQFTDPYPCQRVMGEPFRRVVPEAIGFSLVVRMHTLLCFCTVCGLTRGQIEIAGESGKE
jgi:hypothetical protein